MSGFPTLTQAAVLSGALKVLLWPAQYVQRPIVQHFNNMDTVNRRTLKYTEIGLQSHIRYRSKNGTTRYVPAMTDYDDTISYRN